MSAAHVITAGQDGGLVKPWQVLNLALDLAEVARSLGMTVVDIRSSHVAGSASRYTKLRDQHGRVWFIRVSNHKRPALNPHAVPHLDLVSFHPPAGIGEASAFIGRIVRGEVEWRDPWDPDELKRLRREFERGQA